MTVLTSAFQVRQPKCNLSAIEEIGHWMSPLPHANGDSPCKRRLKCSSGREKQAFVSIYKPPLILCMQCSAATQTCTLWPSEQPEDDSFTWNSLLVNL